MAQLIPEYENILRLKQKPTEGELHLLNFLSQTYDDSFEIYFQPYMNGDRPDIIIMRKHYGIMIIEVKDYELNKYIFDTETKGWKIKSDDTRIIKCPSKQVDRYKKNLYELHIEELFEKNIKDKKHFGIVSCAVYLHKATQNQIEKFFPKKYKPKRINFIGSDNVNSDFFDELFRKRYIIRDPPHKFPNLFTDDIYDKCKKFFFPPTHTKDEGKEIVYTKEQEDIVYSNTKEQKVRSFAGCGKTMVLAGRAVQTYKKTKGKILILTYNITLKNYIHDKISDVREDFPWSAFEILNYHSFISSVLNFLGENHDYANYDNIKLFEKHKNDIAYTYSYDAILIDEIQDFKREWLDIIKTYFLAENGQYILFGDIKQDIYGHCEKDNKYIVNVSGNYKQLKQPYRMAYNIEKLAMGFQKHILKTNDIDEITRQGTIEDYIHNNIIYKYFPDQNKEDVLYKLIIEYTNNKVHSNDITIISDEIEWLKYFESYYRYASKERTTTTFETQELSYKIILDNNINGIIEKNDLQDIYDMIKSTSLISKLSTIYKLYIKYPNTFKTTLDRYCHEINISLQILEPYLKRLIETFDNISSNNEKLFHDIIHDIRRNKKIHFHMNAGTIKISTIHSFKGWECEWIFLIINQPSQTEKNYDGLIYTGITRARSNLIIINFGNEDYDIKLKPIIIKLIK